jgi:hypothetical protein
MDVDVVSVSRAQLILQTGEAADRSISRRRNGDSEIKCLKMKSVTGGERRATVEEYHSLWTRKTCGKGIVTAAHECAASSHNGRIQPPGSA